MTPTSDEHNISSDPSSAPTDESALLSVDGPESKPPRGRGRRGLYAALDQLIWAFQNFIALFSVSKFLSEALGDGGTALGAFAVVSSILALLTGSVMHAVGEYLGVANRTEMQERSPSARAAIYRRSTSVGVVAAVALIAVGVAIHPVAPASLRDAFIWGGVAAIPLLTFEAMRVWLLTTQQVEQALLTDIARFAIHGALTIALPLLGVQWSMAGIMLLWGGAAAAVVLAVDRRAWWSAVSGKIPKLERFEWRRQARYAWDYAFYIGPEFATLWVMGALSSLALAGWFRLLLAAFIPANSFIAGLRALYLVPRSDDRSVLRRLMIMLCGAAGALLLTNALLAWFVPVDFVSRIVGENWAEAHAGLPGLTLQRFGSIFVVMAVLGMRWARDDHAASFVRRIWAVFVLTAAVLTGFSDSVSSAAWIYGTVALTGAVVGAAWLFLRRSPPAAA